MAEVSLTIQSPEGTRTVPITSDRLTLGRGDATDVNIADRGLSLLHASIYREGNRVWIVNESSTNGSWVNGAPVEAVGTPLADGDKISIGDYTTIWVSTARGGGNAVDLRTRPPTEWRGIAIALAVAVSILVGVLGLNWANRRAARVTREQRIDAGNFRGDENQVEKADEQHIGSDMNYKLSDDNSNTSAGDWTQPHSRKLYKQMNEAERLEFTYERARHISRMMGNREYQFTDDVLPYIRQYLDSYARRVGNSSAQLWAEDLNALFARARRYAPSIIRSFNAQGVAAVVGLYIPMIESEYRDCLTSPVGAKGLFQFMPDTARAYGVDPAERCNVEKMAPAAAKYMKHRTAEFGTDAMSVALGIAGYNRSPDSVRRDLHDVLNSENKERSFWTLVANSNKLDRFFQNENIKYVPKFFAAAIVGETPWAFGLEMNSLSSYTQLNDGN